MGRGAQQNYSHASAEHFPLANTNGLQKRLQNVALGRVTRLFIVYIYIYMEARSRCKEHVICNISEF